MRGTSAFAAFSRKQVSISDGSSSSSGGGAWNAGRPALSGGLATFPAALVNLVSPSVTETPCYVWIAALHRRMFLTGGGFTKPGRVEKKRCGKKAKRWRRRGTTRKPAKEKQQKKREEGEGEEKKQKKNNGTDVSPRAPPKPRRNQPPTRKGKSKNSQC
ncbi:hypothetical protein TcG_02912 [Trypanosoma cruzi]|nr:hypothetical protein TcG_02912 [Trypanosoma cruzi]